MSSDPETLAVYDSKAADYARLVGSDQPDPTLTAFLADLPDGGAVLDLGCGPGHAAAAMRDAGFEVHAWDASTGMIEAARALHGLQVRQATFDDIEGQDLYDGIWANFCLLHADRADLPRYLSALARALRPGGQFHIGMKTGEGTSRDTLGRAYTYVTVPELTALLTAAGLTVTALREGAEPGLSGTVDPFVIMRAHA